MAVDVKDQHVSQLVDLLRQTVDALLKAEVQYGEFADNRPDRDPKQESLEANDIASDLQLHEQELDDEGNFNPSIAGCLSPALSLALERTGKRSSEAYAGKDEFSIGSMISRTAVYHIGITGYSIKEALQWLDDSLLEEVARKAIYRNLEEKEEFFLNQQKAHTAPITIPLTIDTSEPGTVTQQVEHAASLISDLLAPNRNN